MKTIDKVVVYVTCQKPGSEKYCLLLFRHVGIPEAGIQVPAGTIEIGESPESAALREIREESGLSQLNLVRSLGIRFFDCRPFGKDEIHRRFFYHYEAQGDFPGSWQHTELYPSDLSAESYLFEFWWEELDGNLPHIIGDQDAMLPELRKSLGVSF